MCDPRTTPTPSDELTAEVRAAAYALLANAWRYPDASSAELFLRSHATDAAWATLDSISGLAPKCRGFRDICDQLSQQTWSVGLERLREDYVRLFGHSVRGSCPPYELEYGRGEIIQQTAELADLSGFYSAFGLQLTAGAFERADHVGVECEFLSVLCAKEAWGEQAGNRDLAETCSDAQRLFLRDHLAKWLPAFAHRVEAADAAGFYGQAASLASAFIHDECRRFDIEIGPQWLQLRPADPERDSTIDCETAGCGGASANGLVQLGMDTASGQA